MTLSDQGNGRGGLDELHSASVRALQFDGRRAFSSIALELGVSEGAARYRVNRLEETGGAHFGELLTERLHRVDGLVAAHCFLVLDIHKLANGWGVGRAAEMPVLEHDRRTARKRKAKPKP